MRLPLAFAAFLALLAAVGYVLLRPRWRWEPEAARCSVTLDDFECSRDAGHPGDHANSWQRLRVVNAPSVSSSSDPFAHPFGETWRS